MNNARLIKKGTSVRNEAKKSGGLKKGRENHRECRDGGVAGWLEARQKNRQDPRKAFAALFSTANPSLVS